MNKQTARKVEMWQLQISGLQRRIDAMSGKTEWTDGERKAYRMMEAEVSDRVRLIAAAKASAE